MTLDLHFALGDVLLRGHHVQEAAVAFRRATELDPRDLSAQFALGTTLEQLGHRQAALIAWWQQEQLAREGNAPHAWADDMQIAFTPSHELFPVESHWFDANGGWIAAYYTGRASMPRTRCLRLPCGGGRYRVGRR